MRGQRSLDILVQSVEVYWKALSITQSRVTEARLPLPDTTPAALLETLQRIYYRMLSEESPDVGSVLRLCDFRLL